MLSIDFDKYTEAIENSKSYREVGKVSSVSGLVITGYIIGVEIGSVCAIYSRNGQHKTLAEVIGFRFKEVILMPLTEARGVSYGSKIVLQESSPRVNVGEKLLGRVLNGLGEPIDGKGPIYTSEKELLYKEVSNPLSRKPIDNIMSLGVKAIDGFITQGEGQRIAIMAGSGVGKSVLMGMIARGSSSDMNVIALIGERGREVREFIENTLGEEGLKRSVVIAVTSDQSALIKKRGAFLATSIAEYFSSKNKNVLLMMDSITRFAMAQREIGLSAGEPPTSKAYTPSVFSLLPKLMERAGNFEGQGSITGLYTVFVEGDDMDEPIADTVRSIADGHIILDRKLAESGHFPSIDVLKSTSRVMRSIVSPEQTEMNKILRADMAQYQQSEDLINIGAYKIGTNPKIDRSIKAQPMIQDLLLQGLDEHFSLEQTLLQQMKILQELGE